jgi:hypothetical protein
MFARFLARDVAIAALALLVFALLAGPSSVPGIPGDFAGVFAGFLLGACALLTHEWGHLLGAVLSRSSVTPGASLRSPFSFSFDAGRNSRGQFVAMSLGGWAGTAAAVLAAYAFLPADDLASRVARGTTLISALLVIAIEVPLVARVLWTGKVPRVETRREPEASQGLA